MHPKRLSFKEHGLQPDLFDVHALSSICKLQQAGFQAYVVGGSIRDLLLGVLPKDFDISTSARPEEIKRLFQRQCLLIGRRFRLAHLRFGSKIIETSTFRSGDSTDSLIVRDNKWGTEEEDVIRRDFTINALFYDPAKEVILDYVGGVKDVHNKLLKTIGNPWVRFRQDPVRMLRCLKFKARFNFECEEKTEQALRECARELLKSSEARVLEEILKMLESTKAAPFFELLEEYNFLDMLFPCFHHFFTGKTAHLAHTYLRVLDIFSTTHKETMSRPVLLGSLIFPILEQEVFHLSQDRQTPLSLQEIYNLTETLLRGIAISSFIHFPKKLLNDTYLVLVNQFRLTPVQSKQKKQIRFTTEEDKTAAHLLLDIRREVHKKCPERTHIIDTTA